MKELKFARPGRVEILVSRGDHSQRLYVNVLQLTGLPGDSRCQHLASVLGVLPASCELTEYENKWALEVGEARFHFEPHEARQLQETFGLQVRHIPARAAS